jgi:tRNA(fMet)-specific endonuclease VapC
VKHVLDTDTIIYFLKGDRDIVSRVLSVPPESLYTTIINYAELMFGAYNSLKLKENLSKVKGFLSKIKILGFDEASGETFGKLKATLRKKGLSIADLDLMIASICIVNDGTLITNNIRDFGKIKELRIENWKTFQTI